MTEPERKSEPFEGFQPTSRDSDPSDPADRPDWLVGAHDGIEFRGEHEARPTTPKPILRLAGPPVPAPVPPPEPRPPAAPAESRDPADGELGLEAPVWAPAGSSIPTLAVASRGDAPVPARGTLDDDLSTPDDLEDDEDTGFAARPELEPALVVPKEPWWLIAMETLATNRLLQVGILAVVAAIAAWTFWPRKENQSTALAAIKRHPQRYEGQSVRVRGEVGEVFDIGKGYVYQLRQQRDTVVVFSPTHRPATHDKLLVQGTVSTGYLDGLPRVALFEAPGARTR